MPVKKDVEELVMEEPKVHTMLRYISSSNVTLAEQGVWSIADVDAHVSEWVNRGYKLIGTHSIGQKDLSQYMQGLSGFGMVYVLAKE